MDRSIHAVPLFALCCEIGDTPSVATARVKKSEALSLLVLSENQLAVTTTKTSKRGALDRQQQHRSRSNLSDSIQPAHRGSIEWLIDWLID